MVNHKNLDKVKLYFSGLDEFVRILTLCLSDTMMTKYWSHNYKKSCPSTTLEELKQVLNALPFKIRKFLYKGNK